MLRLDLSRIGRVPLDGRLIRRVNQMMAFVEYTNLLIA
jgi:hypothetical protein